MFKNGGIALGKVALIDGRALLTTEAASWFTINHGDLQRRYGFVQSASSAVVQIVTPAVGLDHSVVEEPIRAGRTGNVFGQRHQSHHEGYRNGDIQIGFDNFGNSTIECGNSQADDRRLACGKNSCDGYLRRVSQYHSEVLRR